MSHLAAQDTKPGEPMFVDLACLTKAAEMLGLDVVQTSEYAWYGRHVGDFPIPQGMTAAELGHNAKFVLRMNPETRRRILGKHGDQPYDIGIVADPNNSGCYIPLLDFWAQGKGMTKVTGEPVYAEDGSLKILCPTLKQHYDMVCDVEAAREAGDKIDLLTLADATVKYPKLFKAKSKDKSTWVSVTTETRVAKAGRKFSES